ncbi:hypothetical protein TNCT_710331 [Trichonephila clavata]|uniref:Uncharacterized protein n=1 Tax=Trichonephila clavata TaxID=2740835 RepID=A0A8X6G6F3_TRICU|nr:hypothetical protein TNCT_710331 [Trichonephila clavata]
MNSAKLFSSNAGKGKSKVSPNLNSSEPETSDSLASFGRLSLNGLLELGSIAFSIIYRFISLALEIDAVKNPHIPLACYCLSRMDVKTRM